MEIQTIVDNGFEGTAVEVECQISNGLPSMQIVGLANKSVDEAKERIRAAFSSSNIPFPKKRIIINLAPADLPKDQAGLDLAIATSILQASGAVPPVDKSMGFFGELGLNGQVRPIRGIIGKLISANRHNLKSVLIPAGNLRQSDLVDGIDVYGVSTLKELYLHLTKAKLVSLHSRQPDSLLTNDGQKSELDFTDIVGQTQAKRALEIAAAGGHNVLLNGPPGTGKSMLAKAFISILPSMSLREISETTHIHSLHVNKYENIANTRPFRAPHHSASDVAIIGGGQHPRPGEISLAHNGVLFFDEFPEFKRNAIEALRQPLENKTITISRAKDSLELPANFILIATANPCPCGYYGTEKECTCSPHHIYNYRRKLSGPIIDRIDLYANVNSVDHDKLLEDRALRKNENKKIKERVLRAREIQKTRHGNDTTNSTMSNRALIKKIKINPEAKAILDKGSKKLNLSPRAYMRSLKVARTIADIEGAEEILSQHVAEALQYRPMFNLD